MAEAIVFDYEKMSSTVANIKTVAGEYKTAAVRFQNDFQSAIEGWEGESKNKMISLVNDNIMTYLNNLENAVNGLATLLESNANEMKKADDSIAESINKLISSGT